MIDTEKLKKIIFKLPDANAEPAEILEFPYSDTEGEFALLIFTKYLRLDGVFAWALKTLDK